MKIQSIRGVKDILPESRAEYLVASAIKPEEVYPKKQVNIIDKKLEGQPREALLSTGPEASLASMKGSGSNPNSGGSLYEAEIEGTILDGKTNLPLGATIKVYDKETGRLADSFLANTRDGNYNLSLTSGIQYELLVQAPGFDDYKTEFIIPTQSREYSIGQKIKLEKLTDANDRTVGQKNTVDNEFFDAQKLIASN